MNEPSYNSTCCGKELATRFCPHCGAEKYGHDLYTLLSYCQTNLSRTKELFDQRQESGSSRFKGKDAVLRKWAAWVAELERVIGKSE